MCQQDTTAAKSCTNRCPNKNNYNKYKSDGYLLKWNLLSLLLKQFTFKTASYNKILIDETVDLNKREFIIRLLHEHSY